MERPIMNWKPLIVAILVTAGGVGPLLAQSGDLSEDSPRGRVMRGFTENALKIGEALPDVGVFDSAGRAIRLRALKGHYTVLVLGCLT